MKAQDRCPTNTSPYKRLLTDQMRAHILTDQVDPALADMAALEKVSTGGGSLAQLYFGLGKLLEKEMERLKEKGDSAGLAKKQQSFLKFLNALAASKSGQTYDSLQWVGENMLKLGKAQEAAEVFKRIMDSFGKDEAFVTKSPEMIYRTSIKLAAALREQKQWSEAEEARGGAAPQGEGEGDRAANRRGHAPRSQSRSRRRQVERGVRLVEPDRPVAQHRPSQAPRVL